MINEHFVILGALIAFGGILSYLWDTLKGKVKPNKVSWLLWAVAPLIAFSAQIQQGVGYQALLAFTVGLGPLLIFFASFVNKKSYWKIGIFDYICAGFSILALVLWYVTDIGNIAILFSIFADFAASLPTVLKAIKEPETESPSVYYAGTIYGIITLLTIQTWNFETYGFPLYFLIMMGLIGLLIQFKLGRLLVRKNHE